MSLARICDRCGKIIDANDKNAVSIASWTKETGDTSIDYCGDCMEILSKAGRWVPLEDEKND